MQPYKHKHRGFPKFKATHTDLVPGILKGVSRYDKLITKNANRSLKKGERRNAKKQIQQELSNRPKN